MYSTYIHILYFYKGFNELSLRDITEVIHAIKIGLDEKKTINVSLQNIVFQ